MDVCGETLLELVQSCSVVDHHLHKRLCRLSETMKDVCLDQLDRDCTATIGPGTARLFCSARTGSDQRRISTRWNARDCGSASNAAAVISLTDDELAGALGSVLQYARAHGRITRKEAATLCRISANQASRLLRKLRSENKLQQEGHGRSVICVVPPRE